MPLEEARKNKPAIDWNTTEITKPQFIGEKVFDNFPLKELVDYIDWSPFFHTWELRGIYPKILEDKVVGVEATKLFADAQALLKKIVDEKLLTAKGVIGFYPANSVGDDIVLKVKSKK